MEDKNLCKMINVRCRDCNKELKSQPGKTITCGCPNMVTIFDEVVTANDLTRVIMLNSTKKKKHENKLSAQDLAFHEKEIKEKLENLTLK